MIKKGNQSYRILIDDYKIIQGSNYRTKFDILRSLLRFSNGVKPTEYGEEMQNVPELLINEKVARAKDVLLIHISKDYLLSEESKLNSKSLLTKYFETLFTNPLFYDTINTINILFQSLSNELAMISDISGTFTSITPKQLTKLFDPQFLKDECIADEYDMTLEEIIMLQLNMVEYICHNQLYPYYIICIELSVLTPEIYHKIQEVSSVCFILVFLEVSTCLCKDIAKYVLCERRYLDIANEQDLYDMICDNHYTLLNLEEAKQYMEHYIHNENTLERDFVVKLIK